MWYFSDLHFLRQQIKCTKYTTALSLFLLTRGQFYQRVYSQLLRTQIPKAQESFLNWLSLFALLGSTRVKAAHKILMKLTPGSDFTKTYFYFSRSAELQNTIENTWEKCIRFKSQPSQTKVVFDKHGKNTLHFIMF